MRRLLELADIAMYLPYKLRAEIPDYDDYLYYVSEELEIPDKEVSPNSFEVSRVDMSGYVYFSDEYTEESHIETIKPILRPMTDLTKPMIHPDVNGGGEFVPLVYLAKEVTCHYVSLIDDWSLYDDHIRVHYECEDGEKDSCAINFFLDALPLFHKLHFDYNDLIGQDLAVKFND